LRKPTHMKIELKITADGSHTFFVPEICEHYHSTNGAIAESMHVFIEAGLNYFCKENADNSAISIFEVGFGTGLNALLTCLVSEKINKSIVYHSIELHRLESDSLNLLNYSNLVNDSNNLIYNSIINCEWDREIQISNNFKIKKNYADLLNFETDKRFDIIFFDAFAPQKQPEMWNFEVLKKMYDMLENKGILTTYCAKGDVKRLLKSLGFKVELIAGPAGKRHMIRASKQ